MADAVVKCLPESELDSYISSLHEETYGFQDAYFEEDKHIKLQQPKYTTVIETRSFTSSQEKPYFRVNVEDKKGGIANIRIEGNWTSATFEIGGQSITTIYKEMNTNTFLITDNGYCVPFAKHHRVAIDVRGTDITVTYDLVSCDYDSEEDKMLEFLYISLASNYLSDFFSNQFEVRFDHPARKIIAKFEKKLEQQVFLRLNDDIKNHIPFSKVSDTEYVIDFRKTINFTNVKKAEIILNGECDNRVFCYSHVFKLLCRHSGMYSLGFSP